MINAVEPDVLLIGVRTPDKQNWIFLYDETNRIETLRVASRWASNPELSFCWSHAAIVAEKVRDATYERYER